jgi:hypothetical protein
VIRSRVSSNHKNDPEGRVLAPSHQWNERGASLGGQGTQVARGHARNVHLGVDKTREGREEGVLVHDLLSVVAVKYDADKERVHLAASNRKQSASGAFARTTTQIQANDMAHQPLPHPVSYSAVPLKTWQTEALGKRHNSFRKPS